MIPVWPREKRSRGRDKITFSRIFLYFNGMKYLFLLFSFFTVSAKAQVLFNEKYKDCGNDKPCYYCGDSAAYYKKRINERLQYSMDHSMQKWMGTSGHMYFELSVDSSGHSCVKSIKDEVHMSDLKNTLRMSINELYDWQPAILNGHPINSTLIIDIHFLGNRASINFVKPDDF